MTTYVIVGAIVGLALGWVWFTYLFPKVQEELGGTAEGGGMGKTAVVSAVALLLLAAAVGTFLKNRNVLNMADTVQMGFKIWFGFLLPALAVFWSLTRKSLNVLVATAGYWLVTSLVLAILADWMLL